MLMGEVDEVAWHVLYRETNSRLDGLRLSVQECKGLDAALDFCRFLRWSGILKLLCAHSCSGPLPVDGPLLEWKASELMQEVQERFRSGDVQPHIDVAELARINYKLDLIAGQLSQVPTLPKVDAKGVPLRLMQGGAA